MDEARSGPVDPAPALPAPPLPRRAVLAAASGVALAGLLAACAGPVPGPRRTPTRTPAPTPSSSGPATWAALASAVRGRLLRPGDSGWDAARRLRNPRFDGADPLGVLQVAGEDDVVAALAFARATRTPVALRAGGHSYTGWSAGGAPGTAVPRSLVIDTGPLAQVRLEGTTATIGPGARLLGVYEQLAGAGRAIGAGSCATVGIGGLTLGGGVGVLVRSFGLTCDQMTSARVVTADGRALEAVDVSDPDLFWACRGGGGGVYGVVTAMTFRTRAATDVLFFRLAFPWAAAEAVVAAWQRWAPTADPRLWSTLKLLGGSDHPDGPSIAVSGTWTGPRSGADASVDAFVRDTGATPLSHTATSASYGATMRGLAGDGSRVSEAATSSIALAALSGPQIAVLVAQVERASGLQGLTEGGVSLDALGGAVADVAATDSAFPWRHALFDAQYTATFADGADPAPFDGYVRGFRAAMAPAWGTAAYANYCDAAITDPSDYYGPNTARLRSIASGADPEGVFAQPASP